MNLLRVLLRSVCGSHPSDVPPKSKISVQIEQNGNGRRSGAFLHISFKNSSICKAFGVRQRPPQGAEFVCVPCGANNSKSSGGDTVPVRPRSPAPTFKSPQTLDTTGFAGFLRLPAYNSHTNESGNKSVFDCFFWKNARPLRRITLKYHHKIVDFVQKYMI